MNPRLEAGVVVGKEDVVGEIVRRRYKRMGGPNVGGRMIYAKVC